jgi:hypothetical protein
MEICVVMTFAHYKAQMATLVAAGADEDIIELARVHGATIHPQLADDELDRLYGVIESAVMAVDLKVAMLEESTASAGRP